MKDLIIKILLLFGLFSCNSFLYREKYSNALNEEILDLYLERDELYYEIKKLKNEKNCFIDTCLIK